MASNPYILQLNRVAGRSAIMTMWLGAPNTIHVAPESIQTVEMEILDKEKEPLQLEKEQKETMEEFYKKKIGEAGD